MAKIRHEKPTLIMRTTKCSADTLTDKSKVKLAWYTYVDTEIEDAPMKWVLVDNRRSKLIKTEFDSEESFLSAIDDL